MSITRPFTDTREISQPSSSGIAEKLKLENQQEFVIGGFRPDGRMSVDALVVGYFESKHLKFAGKVRELA